MNQDDYYSMDACVLYINHVYLFTCALAIFSYIPWSIFSLKWYVFSTHLGALVYYIHYYCIVYMGTTGATR